MGPIGAAEPAGRGTDPCGNAPSSWVLPWFFDGVGGLPEDAAADGCAMLGIISVPGMGLRLTKLDESSALGAPDATGIDPAEGRDDGADGGADEALLRASTKAPRCELTLLTASGETCPAAFGSPMPGAVVASSGETEIGAGGGP